ncbi:MAG: HD domain-containing phosphohydrolase, partial [Acidiferrobacterales bacterium]
MSDRIDKLYQYVASRFDFVDHISVVIYEPVTAVLKSFLATGNGPSPLINYQAKLEDVRSLQEILRHGKPRIINDLLQYSNSTSVHNKRLIEAGYRSSYTIPMYMGDEFYGFVFYNSLTSSAFTGDVITHLDPIARLLSLIVIHDIRSIHTLTAATRTAQHMASRRDYETGAHLQRMSRYSRLVAGLLSKKHELTDEILEHIFLFAPLHDIGKITIPDKILLKPGKLTKNEYRIMKTHVDKGLEIINYMLTAFHLSEMSHIDILTNIVLYHHESYDGSGYPRGLVGK